MYAYILIKISNQFLNDIIICHVNISLDIMTND